MARIIDCHNHIGADLLFYLQGNYPYCQDMVTMMELGRGIDYWMVFPMVSHLGLDITALRENRIEDSHVPTDIPYALENRRMLEEIHKLFPEEGKRMLPLVMLDPVRKVKEQIRELNRLLDEYPSVVGLKVQATIIQAPILNLLKEGKAFLELAEKRNLPILIHTSYKKDDIWSQSHDICDIAEQTPGVRFCMAHSCRFDRSALDRVAAMPNAWFDCSAHVIHCQAAGRGYAIVPPDGSVERFPSDYRNPSQVLRDLAEAYPDKLMWGSDSPFYSYVDHQVRLTCTYKEELDCLHALPQELLEKAAWRNTLQFLQKEL